MKRDVSNPIPAAPLQPPLPATKNAAQPSSPPYTVIYLNVGRMTVEGISHRDQARMTQSMEQEFARLVRLSPEVPWQAFSSVDRINANAFPAGASAEEIGRHVAAEIFRGLRR